MSNSDGRAPKRSSAAGGTRVVSRRKRREDSTFSKYTYSPFAARSGLELMDDGWIHTCVEPIKIRS
eukprot:6194839-Pleurochrysis_carterae.AAC.5